MKHKQTYTVTVATEHPWQLVVTHEKDGTPIDFKWLWDAAGGGVSDDIDVEAGYTYRLDLFTGKADEPHIILHSTEEPVSLDARYAELTEQIKKRVMIRDSLLRGYQHHLQPGGKGIGEFSRAKQNIERRYGLTEDREVKAELDALIREMQAEAQRLLDGPDWAATPASDVAADGETPEHDLKWDAAREEYQFEIDYQERANRAEEKARRKPGTVVMIEAGDYVVFMEGEFDLVRRNIAYHENAWNVLDENGGTLAVEDTLAACKDWIRRWF